AAAKQALLAKMRARPSQSDTQQAERAELRAAELAAARKARTVAKGAEKQAASDAVLEAQVARLAAEDADVQVKRGARKGRKALSAAEAKARRDAKYAARKARS